MSQHISCNDVVPGCKWTAEAATEEELMQKVVQHAAEEHDLRDIPPEVAAKVKEAIQTR